MNAQSTAGSIHGAIRDNLDAVVPGVAVTIRNVDTNASRTLISDERGIYRFLNMALGNYELTAPLGGFATYTRSGIILLLDRYSMVDIHIQPAGVTETIEVRADAPLLNTANAEVGVRFDRTCCGTAGPKQPQRLRAGAVGAWSQRARERTNRFAGENRTGFSVNGMRLRSNNWMIDGQDDNDPNAGNRHLTINNPDIVQEVRLITNQFAAEYGRAAGSVVNVITKSGTNAFRGSAFIFHNNAALNSRSNLDKSAGLADAPERVDNQIGGTIGGPILTDRTFFFGSFQRWTDRRLASGFTLSGAPTEAGRQILQSVVGDRPQVQALLRHLPAGTANGGSATFTVDGRNYTVPLGSLTGSAPLESDNSQLSARIDQQLASQLTLVGRYLMSQTPRNSSGDVQVTPPGLTSNNSTSRHALNVWATRVFGSTKSNEFRLAWSHLSSRDDAESALSFEIP